jgi:DNA-binding NtrC family response regulator
MEAALEALGAAVVALASAAEFDAWLAQGGTADFALFDLDLGEGERGTDLATRFVAATDGSTPVAIMTGRTDAATVRELDRLGLRWFAKPVGVDTLDALLSETC